MSPLAFHQAGTFPLRAPMPCPDCGGRLTLDEVLVPQTWALPYFDRRATLAARERLRPAVYAICSGCEFGVEVRA